MEIKKRGCKIICIFASWDGSLGGHKYRVVVNLDGKVIQY